MVENTEKQDSGTKRNKPRLLHKRMNPRQAASEDGAIYLILKRREKQ